MDQQTTEMCGSRGVEVPEPVLGDEPPSLRDPDSFYMMPTEPDFLPSTPKSDPTDKPDRGTPSSCDQSQKPTFSRARRLWRRAYLRIKGQKAVEKINANILNYGTTELTDGDKRYKANLDELLELKVQKKERFRLAESKNSVASGDKRFLLYPKSQFRQYWTILITVLMLYVAVVSPYRLAFTEDVYFDGWTIFDFVLNGVFCLDIIVNFCTCHEMPDGSVEDRRSKIAIRYLKKWFLIDLISSVPFNLLDFALQDVNHNSKNFNNAMRLARLPRLYKLFRLVKVFKALGHYRQTAYMEGIQDFFQVNSRLVKLTKFLIIVCFCVHLMGCIWFFSAKLTDFEPDSWVVRCGFMDSSTYEQYIASVYWAVTTMVTVGYGDIAAKTWMEMVFAIVWMFIGVGFYSFTVGSLSSFLTSVDTRDSILSSKMAAVHEFAKETNISGEIRAKVRDAVRYYNWKMGSVWSDKHSLFNDIPRSLQYEVALSMHGGIIKDLQFFSGKGRSFVLHFMPLFKPLKHSNGAYLYKEGEYADEMFFISKGRVNLVLFPHEIAYKSYLRGSYVGEIEIVKLLKRIDNAQVFGDSEFLSVTRSDVLQALSEFPVEAQDILTVANERYHRHRQARMETMELLRLKKQLGSLSELAGQERAFSFKDTEEQEATAEECMKR